MSGQPPEPSARQNGHENAPEASGPASGSSNVLTLGNRIDLTIEGTKLFVAQGTHTRCPLSERNQRLRELGDLENADAVTLVLCRWRSDYKTQI